MPDTQQLDRVFALLNQGGGVSWTAKAPKGHAIVGNTARTSQALQTHAAQQDGWNFFVCLNQTNRTTIKPAKSDIAVFSCIGLDVDPPAGLQLEPLVVGTALDSTLSSLLGYKNNHVVISSGRGLWAWVFVEPQLLESKSAQENADRLIKGFTDAVGAQAIGLHGLGMLDSSCADLSRIARCPGTVNYKSGAMARILIDYEPIEPVPISMVESVAAPFIRELAPSPTLVSGESLFDIAPHMNITTRQFVLLGTNSAAESRHRRVFSSAKNLHELGVTKDLAEFCLWSGAERCTPNLNRTDPGFIQKVMAQVWT